jgi:signal transduction histidine kinase
MKGGTGLGLHGVYNAVNFQLGGQILCESVLGEGTKYSIKWKETS